MSMQDAPAVDSSSSRGSLRSVLGWATYLGCSWTWCIGMFLPVLLVRDYGVWGFVVFAVPNVIGAGAMGWVLRDASVSRRFVEKNREAVYLFSAITIAFHAYWVAWLATWILGVTGQGYVEVVPALVGAIVLAGALSKDQSEKHRGVSVGLWVFSIGVLAAFLLMQSRAPFSPPTTDFFTTTDAMGVDLLAFAPVCVFGFALCPYLDATFHRARQGTSPRGGRAAFTIGFGVCFASMIVLTLVYAGPFVESFNGPEGSAIIWTTWAAVALFAHLAMQLVFTVRVHQHASAELEPKLHPRVIAVRRILPLVAVLLAVGTVFSPWMFDMSAGELGYRCFISAYGLVLPAYVWVCGIPTRDGHSGISGERGRFKLRVLLVAVVVALPMYFVGYILMTEWWLLPGLAVLLLARVAVMGKPARG